jgi:para-nitrobenzyl esterase
VSSTVETTIADASRPRRNRAHLILRYFSPELKGVKIMNTTHSHPRPLAAFFAALGLILATAGFTVVDTVVVAAAPRSGGTPIVTIEGGAVRGVAVASGYAFRGLPYAAPPTGNLRWRPPEPAAKWNGVRDATQFAPSCPQRSVFFGVGVRSEDCLYLNVYTPSLRGKDLPVFVWIHGGGWTTGAGRDYNPTKLMAEGIVVVTINYRLGALGFLAHPALASRPGGSSGNYGHMDQQAALRWVQRNIGRFGGDEDNVTIAGESAGGLSVLVHLVSDESRGLFDRAIVQSGSFALTQQSLAEGEAFGQTFATLAGCPDQTAECLRNLSVDTLVNNFQPNVARTAIPGIIDGKVLRESLGTALAAGRFADVPVLNGVNHDEQRVFVILQQVTVTRGTYVPILEWPITAENYERNIAAVLGVSDARAAEIVAEYPLAAYPSPEIAFSTLDNDAWWACPALQMNQWLAKRVPTFAYEFNDDNAPSPGFPPLGVATHGHELVYLFDLPDVPLNGSFNPDQQVLAASMRAAWARFTARGNPSSAAVPWPSFRTRSTRVLSLVPPQPQVETDFAARHHCSFWAAP